MVHAITEPVITVAVRKLNDLADVARAIAVAARLMGEKLETVQAELLQLFNDTKEGDNANRR
jgi:hypothetical protein